MSAPEGFDEDEMWIEEIHDILCPGGDAHVPGACEPTTPVLEIVSRHDAALLAPVVALIEKAENEQGNDTPWPATVFSTDLRAAITDPDAVAKHNAAIERAHGERIARAIEDGRPDLSFVPHATPRREGEDVGMRRAAHIARTKGTADHEG